MRRNPRDTTADVPSHAGVPGEDSGRQRRHGRNPATSAAAALARKVLGAEGIVDGDLGIAFVPPEEMRGLKAGHLGIDEATDVLSFPIDGTGDLPAGPPRQLGDAVICPQVTGDAWSGPLVHGLLHLLGYDHGAEMEAREEALR